MSDLAIRFENVSKCYRLGGGQTSLREILGSLPAQLIGRNGKDTSPGQWIWALRDLNIQVSKGEVLGLIGPNGAGKTTVLKLLANVTRPASGQIERAGRLAALIELGAGFHPDLTGRENVYLNGAILGLRKREIDELFDDIVSFAELEQFIDTPVKRYSSGMYVRLGFAVAAHVNPDILVIDEVLAVGDTRFQSKCYRTIIDQMHRGATVILVSHNLYAIMDYCTTAAFMNEGRIVFSGNPREAVRNYQQFMDKRSSGEEVGPRNREQESKLVRVLNVAIRGSVTLLEKNRATIVSGERLELHIEYEIAGTISKPVFGIDITSTDGKIYTSYATDFDKLGMPCIQGRGVINLSFDSFLYPVGTYSVGVVLSEERQERHLLWRPEAANLIVLQSDQSRGAVALPHKWSHS